MNGTRLGATWEGTETTKKKRHSKCGEKTRKGASKRKRERTVFL